MILFINKKAINIFKAIISLFLLSLSLNIFAAEDLVSFCFTPAISVEEPRDALNFLLLPKEKVYLRPEQRCIDVLTSTDRVKLLEKYLRLRYTLVEEEGSKTVEEPQHCQLEMKKTGIRNTDTTNASFGLGMPPAVSASNINSTINESSQLLLGLGKAGTLVVGSQALYVECRKGATGIYQLIFSLTESGANRISSEVSAKKNEPVNIGQISRELNERSRVLGLPQTAVSTAIGVEEVTYQLIVKE